MTQHFTTPELSRVLKEFGIEIETPFKRLGNEIVIQLQNEFSYVKLDGTTHKITHLDVMAIYPAYLLTQVLGWLPDTVELEELEYDLHRFYDKENGLTANYHHFFPEDDLQYISNMHMTPEETIIEGLKKGWLTKEIIETAAKNNKV